MVLPRLGPYARHVATHIHDAELVITPSPGEMVEVYFWTKRAWLSGRCVVDVLGQAFVVVPGYAPLRYGAAELMGLRRLVH